MKRTILFAILLVIFLLVTVQNSWTAEVPFDTQQVIYTNPGNNAPSVVTVDLDGDGDLDVVSTTGGWTVAWHENTDGAGTFGNQNVISTAVIDCREVYSADLDGDGDPDVLSADSYNNTIAWYENRLNDGINNDFNPIEVVISTTTDLAITVSAADVDGDGDLDVLSASRADDKIAWYENTTGSGIFSTEKVIDAVAVQAKCVTTGDVDGDGDLDVLSSSRTDMVIAWYENLSIHHSALIPQLLAARLWLE